jgi:hypothetical protein
MMTKELDRAQALLEQHGWKVERPPFDDPYEIMFRRLLAVTYGTEGGHPEDDPTNAAYEWQGCEAEALRFLKEHFVLKTEEGDGQ